MWSINKFLDMVLVIIYKCLAIYVVKMGLMVDRQR
jgi:hypothetical protein